MDQPDRHGALADRRCDSLDRARAHVADGEDSRPTGLQEEGAIAVELGEILDVPAGEQEAGVVGGELPVEPLRVRVGADEDEEGLGGMGGSLTRAGVVDRDALQLAVPLEPDAVCLDRNIAAWPAELPPPTITTESPAQSCASAWVAA